MGEGREGESGLISGFPCLAGRYDTSDRAES